MAYVFTNIIGCFILDDKLNIIDKILFQKVGDYKNKETAEKKLKNKHKVLQSLPENKLSSVLNLFKDKQYHQQFYKINVSLTKQAIKNSVTEDQFIIHTIANINELDKTTNLLTKRLREWYSIYLPELSEEIDSNEIFVELVNKKSKEELLKEINLSAEESMGADLKEIHLKEIQMLAKRIIGLYQLRKEHEEYLQKIMKIYCPNLLELAGTTIAAKLLELAKGLKRMALLPSSTVQLLGAEKALFRHLKTGSRSPKYGVIINHPLIQKAARTDKGKAARNLADKLSLCARLDFFKGEFKAKEYKKELEEKFR